ncbi:alpha-amylase [Arthrobacter sp. MYb23]|uniref:glycoside hydrolase family 13 protein n=1 Tax=unclassified Arthrobacter TaxID=235627 RepID=UPI000CFC5FA4|nr:MULTISPECIES: glycoside hydrolase family 13 protein [unclassified Arthrobacter]PRB43454.1 alpha-amylase [Arthrobacter sp. MYb51]PRB93698.1 alpha-amylase [Arthrobacter sp. MYb23]
MAYPLDSDLTIPLLLSEDAAWWRQAAVYQIYPRSFADSNGDGIGDLKGITSRVPYLKTLGVDAVWLSPFYPSALADGGYDVDDYRDVDPKIGTLADFDEMTAALHHAGIRVIVDIVPNHSSNRHAWFQEALAAGRGSAARKRYIFREGLGDQGELPPSDWTAAFGGPRWSRVTEPDGSPGQWYLHTFTPEQPDWNWENPEVREDFLKTLRFWSDRGVDGFRVDVANMLVKDLPDQLPSKAELDLLDRNSGTHPLFDRDEVHEIYRDWRKVFNEYNPPRFAVAEAWVETAERRARYASPEGLGQAFSFDLLMADFDATQFRDVIEDNLNQVRTTGSTSTWVFSNHDVTRHATRYGLAPLSGRNTKQGIEWVKAGGPRNALDIAGGIRRARAASLLMLALPGSAYLYQGEELGLHEVAQIPGEDRQDPSFLRGAEWDGLGRDGCRVPLPWTPAGTSFGFGANAAHLPQPAWFADYAVSVQEVPENSTLNLYRRALAFRHKLQSAESLDWVDTGGKDVLAFTRPGGWLCVTNFGDAPVELPTGEIILASQPLEERKLPAQATAWLRN